MRYLPLLLLVLAGNVSAQSPWKSDYPEYLPVLVLANGCEQWFTEAEVEEVAEGELLRARLKNDLPADVLIRGDTGLVRMTIAIICTDNGMSFSSSLYRVWPGTDEFVTSVPQLGVFTGRMTNKSTLLNGLKDNVYAKITYFLIANQ